MSRLYNRLPPRLRSYGHVLRARLLPDGQRPPRPSATHLVLSWRCNVRCKGCGAWKREPTGELTVDQWRRVFAKLYFLDIVKIIGGEPFVYEEIDKLVLAIRDEINPHIVQLVTNGTHTDRVVDFVERHAWPSLHMRLSLDGLAESHDSARGVEGTFDKVMATMEALAAIRKRKRFQLAVNLTVTDSSLEDVDPLVQLCDRLGVDLVPGFKVKPFLHHAVVSPENMKTLDMDDPGRTLRRLHRGDLGARSGFNPVERLALRLINSLVFRKQVRGGESLKFACKELRNLMYLFPGGELVTCGLRHEPVGNLYEQSFDEVWYSPRAARARDEVDGCTGCMQGAVEIMSKLYGG